MELIVNIDKLSKLNGQVTGKIFFSFEGIYFPEKDWDDFVVIIINWWLEQVLIAKSDEDSEIELVFMDGPYSLVVKRKDGNDASIVCLSRNTSIQEYIVNKADFFDEIYKAAQKLSEKCTIWNWENADTLSLEKNLRLYRKLFQS